MIITGDEKPQELHWLVRYANGRFEAVQRFIERRPSRGGSEVIYASEEEARQVATELNFKAARSIDKICVLK